MTHFLITGGAGFIGSHLVDDLLADGHQVTVIDNFMLGQRAFLSQHAGNSRLTVIEADLSKPGFGDHAFAGVDVCYHLAANSDIVRGVGNHGWDMDHTFLSTLHTLEAIKKHGVPELVFASSSAIYGDLAGPLTETSGPCLPVSFYGAGKLASEGFIAAFSKQHNIHSWIVRFPNVVGGRSTHGVLHDFVRKLRASPHRLEVLGDGRQEKPYIHVRDLLAGIAFVRANFHDPLNLVALGPPVGISVREIATIVIEEMQLAGVEIAYTGGEGGWKGDVPRYSYDCSRAVAKGWKQPASSEQAIRKSVREIIASN
jgi:UDP-glucose 4-epimerase